MASAAAVAADQARSPIDNDLGEDLGAEKDVTSGIYAADEVGPAPDDDSDEDLPSNPMRSAKRARPAEEAPDDGEGDGVNGDDLFGDEEEGGAEVEKPVRELDDEELDSGDDMDRLDRVQDEAEAEPEYIAQEKITMDLEYPRLPGPEPSDGEMYLLKVPNFMGIDPYAWHHTTFQPPTTDHHNFSKMPSQTFSASKTALSTIRWRHSPSNPEQLQSNARILRWSDGSLTLQLASDPTTQFDLEGKAIAPPQRNPIKPTPTSTTDHNKAGRQGMGANLDKFDSRKDGFTYLLRPYDENGTMLVTHKVTTGLQVRVPDNSEDDDAIAKLKASLAAGNRSQVDGDKVYSMSVDENPEKAREAALAAMKDLEKRNKKAQAAQEREAAKANRALGRSGLSSNRYGGLNASMLEDDEEGGGGGRSRPTQKRPKPSRRRRNSEYSEDEDFGGGRRGGATREDEYEEDDFMVDDDEEEVVEDDDDPDDGIVEEERPRSSRERTPKRSREEVDDEADAEGEEVEDDAPVVRAAGVKKRRVVDDDEDDE